jgi:hypothetical protein
VKKGQRYWSPRFGHQIEVTRVSREQLWADIIVTTAHHRWRKRQALVEGRFAFDVEEILA